MKQYSKGPWWLSDKQPDAVLTADPSASEGYRYAEDNLQYYGGHLVAESIAPQNRPLIAAAPDMLEACEEALAWIQDHTLVIALDVKDSLRMAIAKAKGQSPA